MSDNSINKDSDIKPWYKQAWPWFIISIPATSIVLGVNMFYLAYTTNNSLVVDDYYKQGKGINQRIERDKTASRLGLSALVNSSEEGVLLQLEQQSTATNDNLFVWPDSLSMRWIHVTQAHKDGATLMQHIGQGRYLAPAEQLPDNGRWRIHVQPNELQTTSAENAKITVDWRLVSEQITLTLKPELLITAKKPTEKVTS